MSRKLIRKIVETEWVEDSESGDASTPVEGVGDGEVLDDEEDQEDDDEEVVRRPTKAPRSSGRR